MSSAAPTQPILVVEDSPEDYEATVRALRKFGVEGGILHCADGDTTLDFLHRRGAFEAPQSAPRPGVILLDLNLPGTDGREVLAEIKSDPVLRMIPVIVFTCSSYERDVAECYAAGANSYVQKPVDRDGFQRAVESLNGYWFVTSLLPQIE